MYTEGVLSKSAKTNLKELIETAGRVYPHGTNDCIGMVIQIDPDATGSVEVIGSNSASGYGIFISTDDSIGPGSISFRSKKVEHVDLAATEDDILTRVLVED